MPRRIDPGDLESDFLRSNNAEARLFTHSVARVVREDSVLCSEESLDLGPTQALNRLGKGFNGSEYESPGDRMDNFERCWRSLS